MKTLPVATTADSRRAAVREVAADKWLFTAVLALSMVATGVGLIGPWLLGTIVDTVQASADATVLRTVDLLALTIVVATIVQIVLTRYALYVGYRFGERAAARIRERFLGQALELPAATVEHVPRGDFIARGSADVTAVTAALRQAAPEVLVALIQVVFLIGAVLVLDPLLGALGLSFLLIVITVVRWYLRRARNAYLAQAATESQLADIVTATASGARTIEAFGLQERRTEASEEVITEARRARLRTLRLRTVLFPSLDISYVLPIVGVLLLGSLLYGNGMVSLGTIVAATMYLRRLIEPLDTLSLWIDRLQAASASYARPVGITTTPRRTPPTAAEPSGDQLDVTNVWYSYDGGPDVLRGVSLDIRPGERLAIVGVSGAGKSTLARLLAGVDGPESGTITVGGVPIADLAPEQLRRQIVLVTQEHHVFHDTLKDNLRIANPDATDSELRDALAAVGADWVEDLPHGLDTKVGSDGQLDAAQTQQLSLARVILADPHTLILDEATAMLDPTTARNTERSLARVLHGRTVIAIAHRLQTAYDADRVAVMDEGRVSELGSHDDLVAKGGTYGSLWSTWHGAADHV